MSLFVYTVVWFLDSYGFGQAEVVAPNPVQALLLAQNDEHGWMLADPCVRVSSITRGPLAHCQHWNGDGIAEDMYECEDCGLVYRSVWGEDNDAPAPSATNAGFRAYCANLTVR